MANRCAIIVPLGALFNDKIAHLKFSCEIAVSKSNTYLNAGIVMLCLACSALAGCGTKGPLYIPEQRYPQEVTQPTPPAVPESPTIPPAN